jgi:hypothetical protein
MTGMYKGYVNSIVPDIREKTSSFNEEKTWLDLHREQSSCNLRTDLESDICAYMYVCLLFVNGLIRVMPKAIHTYVHHNRKPMCIAFTPMTKCYWV